MSTVASFAGDEAAMRHSSVSVTFDRYGHLYDGLDAQIADGLDDLLRSARRLPAA